MILNLGSSIRAKILWRHFLSNACKRKEKIKELPKFVASCTTSSFNS
jgi:hypothetical protein